MYIKFLASFLQEKKLSFLGCETTKQLSFVLSFRIMSCGAQFLSWLSVRLLIEELLVQVLLPAVSLCCVLEQDTLILVHRDFPKPDLEPNTGPLQIQK